MAKYCGLLLQETPNDCAARSLPTRPATTYKANNQRSSVIKVGDTPVLLA